MVPAHSKDIPEIDLLLHQRSNDFFTGFGDAHCNGSILREAHRQWNTTTVSGKLELRDFGEDHGPFLPFPSLLHGGGKFMLRHSLSGFTRARDEREN